MPLKKDDIAALASDAAFALIPKLTQDLKRAAATAGWPTSITEALTITYNNGNLDIEYPASMAKAIDNLEYGSEGTPPQAVLRPFRNRADTRIVNVLGTRTLNQAISMLEVL